MADLKITGRMKVSSVQKDFKKAFGSTLRIYNGARLADGDASIASIRKGDAKGGEFTVNGNTQVGNFEKKVLETFGVKVQVASPDDSKLVDNSITLTASGK
ncbi:hypothetical protein BPO_1642 [Bergeyella porcorum]|uniref:Uncharacterized protein n=1 Tax=Bergeyella porcorum TaxID=1735111 RepID=A0AAU0F4B9_9FLAO